MRTIVNPNMYLLNDCSDRFSNNKLSLEEQFNESTKQINYRMNPDQLYNKNNCYSMYGPANKDTRSIVTYPNLVNIESDLTNRNIITSKNRDASLSNINVNNYKIQNERLCNNFLEPIPTRLEDTQQEYSLNRFYNLPNPQRNIYWDRATNTQLEAKDNYIVPKK